MTSILTADRWLYSTLTGDSTLTGLVAGRVFNEQAQGPVQTAYPMVVFRRMDDGRAVMGIGTAIILFEQVYLVKAIGRGNGYEGIEPITNRILTLLHGKAGEVAGYGSVLACVAESPISFVENEDGISYWTLGYEFRIMTQ